MPAVTVTSTSTGGLKQLLEGTMLANPLISVVPVLCVAFKITGMAESSGSISPSPPTVAVPPGRSTVFRKGHSGTDHGIR